MHRAVNSGQWIVANCLQKQRLEKRSNEKVVPWVENRTAFSLFSSHGPLLIGIQFFERFRCRQKALANPSMAIGPHPQLPQYS
jgi:hypothetical protein